MTTGNNQELINSLPATDWFAASMRELLGRGIPDLDEAMDKYVAADFQRFDANETIDRDMLAFHAQYCRDLEVQPKATVISAIFDGSHLAARHTVEGLDEAGKPFKKEYLTLAKIVNGRFAEIRDVSSMMEGTGTPWAREFDGYSPGWSK